MYHNYAEQPAGLFDDYLTFDIKCKQKMLKTNKTQAQAQTTEYSKRNHPANSSVIFICRIVY